MATMMVMEMNMVMMTTTMEMATTTTIGRLSVRARDFSELRVQMKNLNNIYDKWMGYKI